MVFYIPTLNNKIINISHLHELPPLGERILSSNLPQSVLNYLH